MTWRRLLAVMMLVPHLLNAASMPVPLLSLNIDTQNKAALQRGARLYMNYCSGCHSLKYFRYNAMAKGLGLTTFTGEINKPLLVNHLIFTQSQPTDPIEISLSKEDARQWFGIVPPDLSLTARSRGIAWLYAYLNSFYEDPNKPFRTNNLIYPDVAMPDVLSPLRGTVRLDPLNQGQLIRIEKGLMDEREFQHTLKDLVTFLAYVAEPIRDDRQTLGYLVLVFLLVLLVVTYLLKRSYKI